MPLTASPATSQLRRVIVLPDADLAFERALLAALRVPGALTPTEFAARIRTGRRARQAP